MRHLFDAHEKRLPGIIVPTPRFLLQNPSAPEEIGLPFDLKSKRAPHAADGVHVFNFDLRSQFSLPLRTNGDVTITSQLALFHVRIADASVFEDLSERRK